MKVGFLESGDETVPQCRRTAGEKSGWVLVYPGIFRMDREESVNLAAIAGIKLPLDDGCGG